MQILGVESRLDEFDQSCPNFRRRNLPIVNPVMLMEFISPENQRSFSGGVRAFRRQEISREPMGIINGFVWCYLFGLRPAFCGLICGDESGIIHFS
ncbi:MAG: hypothetical protein ACKVT0_21485 [Planctomycetaceae bacterium]